MAISNVRLLDIAGFMNVVGEAWRVARNDEAMSLRDVLAYTVRRCPVKNVDDAERAYELLLALRRDNSGSIELRKQDYDWMVGHFKDMGHNVWLGPDAAFLVHYLKDNVLPVEPQ